ncbi:hypothetical protein GCM10027566_24800 [Arachidicoccus ginsenosidivorans]
MEDFLRENSAFPLGGSIRNLLVHVANTYQFWILKRALQMDLDFTQYTAIRSIQEAERLLGSIDTQIIRFIDQFESTLFDKLQLEVKGRVKYLSPLELFTHVTTHEFHHKGQILLLSRHLGYTPVDTDVVQ